MPFPHIEPPLLNSASPWATSRDDLQKLFDSPYTGAVTTRTSLLSGFEHDEDIHQYTFFEPSSHRLQHRFDPGSNVPPTFGGSLNTLGYSPFPLSRYLAMIPQIVRDSTLPETVRDKKVFIVSVTGSADEVVQCYRQVQALQAGIPNPLCMEVNLSCPNIPGKPPPAYSKQSLAEYLNALNEVIVVDGQERIPIGIKTPPYTYHDQFRTLIEALLDVQPTCPIEFMTATNTLGSSLILDDDDGNPALGSASGTGIGGLAGVPMHPLALGNVKTIRMMLDQNQQLRVIKIIGVGGVSDGAGFARMRAVGADAIGVATALGREGIDIFRKISQERDVTMALAAV